MHSQYRDYLASFGFALFVCSHTMSLIFSTTGVFVYTLIASVLLIIYATNFSTLRRLLKRQLLVYFYILFLFLLSAFQCKFSGGNEEALYEYFSLFCLTGTGALIISNNEYDFDKVMRCFIVLSFLLAPVLLTSSYSTKTYEVSNDEWMAYSYRILPFLVAAVYYLYSGTSKCFRLLSILLLVLFFSVFISHTARGPFVALVGSVLFLLIQKQIKKGIRLKVILGELFVFLFFVIIGLDLILEVLGNLTNRYELRFMSKFLFADDISNQRTPIYINAFNGFVESPLWGNGISSFVWRYNAWPHNIFLQMMYETGILMLIPFSYILFQSVKMMISKYNTIFDNRLISFLFIISITELMFSQYFWKKHYFWLLIWATLYNINWIKQIKFKTLHRNR